MKLFDTIMGSPGRDYVIDLPVPQTENFFATYSQLDFHIEATQAGFQIVVFFIVDKDYSSLRFSEDVQRQVAPALFIPVRNIYIGSALVPRSDTLSIDIPELDRDVMNLVEARHFSLRNFILGDEGEHGGPALPETQDFPARNDDGAARHRTRHDPGQAARLSLT